MKTLPRFAAPLFAAAVALIAAAAPAVVRADDGVAAKPDATGATTTMSKMGGMDDIHSRYGGPAYGGAPALTVTAALVKAGGGPKSFSIAKALTSMVGPELVTAEVKKLNEQYDEKRVGQWVTVFDFAVADALKHATAAGVKLPKPALKGKDLAATLVTAGLDADNTFYVEFLLDKAVTHGIHEQVMEDIDARFGAETDTDYHRITNQAMFDLAQALGDKQVKLAELH